MRDERYLPVWITVQRPDGTVEEVPIGTAVRTRNGFSLQLGQLRIGTDPRRPLGTIEGAGLHAAAPINTVSDLEALASRARRTLADPKKMKWHAAERALLSAIESELARKRTPPER